MDATPRPERRRNARRDADRSALTDHEWRGVVDSDLQSLTRAVGRLDPDLGKQVEGLREMSQELQARPAVPATDAAYLTWIARQLPREGEGGSPPILDEIRQLALMAGDLRVFIAAWRIEQREKADRQQKDAQEAEARAVDQHRLNQNIAEIGLVVLTSIGGLGTLQLVNALATQKIINLGDQIGLSAILFGLVAALIWYFRNRDHRLTQRGIPSLLRSEKGPPTP